ncbi:MAG TPA: hypothetical protein VFK35_03755 [Candidatus Limnocylindrales bacterium]|nr:hypothetical protein [Candidatus Limnocylindrales bacterium]
MRTLTFRSRRLSLAGLAIAALLAIGASGGQAADPFVAGGRSTRPVAAAAGDLARAEARGRALIAALGIPATSHRAARLDDRFEHRVVDEVTSLDGQGREAAVSRFELDGRVAMVAALGWRAGGGPPVDAAGATRSAAALARVAGLVPDGPPVARRSAGAGGWSVQWQRTVGGVAVRGDGLRIHLWPDGTFHGLVRTERPLAAAPSATLSGAQALTVAERAVAERVGSASDGLRVTDAELAWVAPNDLFEPAAPDAPAETLRLAWIIRFEAHGPLAERLRSVEVWIDAGDGRLLGGDVAA